MFSSVLPFEWCFLATGTNVNRSRPASSLLPTPPIFIRSWNREAQGFVIFLISTRPCRAQPIFRSKQWRIHFHVPLFTSQYGAFGSTQDYVRQVIAIASETRFTNHLEIETYTWDVLPAGLKMDLLDSITREYGWVLDTIDRVGG